MRTRNEIQIEYAQTCQALGDLTYRISAFQEEADKLQLRLHNLNVEEQKRAKAQGAEVELPAADAQPGTETSEVVEAANE